MAIDQKMLDQAADWHAAMAGDDPDFDGFTAWLEASPDHVGAYDQVVALDGVIDAHRRAINAATPANDVGVAGRTPRRQLFAVALAVALVLPGAYWFGVHNAPVALESGDAPMQIALDDRTRIDIDRNSVLRHAKGETDRVELAQGAAHFSVRHDPAHRFTVTAGEVSIVDMGTQFEIQRNGDQVGIAVADGSVAISYPDGKPLTLVAGQRAWIEHGQITTGAVDVASISSWRSGLLVYRDAPLQQVAKEISRYTPVPVSVDPAQSGRRFSGVLTIGDGRALDRNLADFMGLARIEQGDAVRIGARP